MARCLLLLSCLLLGACSGPFAGMPGGALSGTEAAWGPTDAEIDTGVIALETRTSDPYSVYIGVFPVDGRLYIDPAESRTWYGHLQADPRVRVRFDGSDVVYLARVRREEDPAILQQFEPDRIVMELVAR